VIGELNRRDAETMHSLVYHLRVLLVTTVYIQLVLSSTVQSASTARTSAHQFGNARQSVERYRVTRGEDEKPVENGTYINGCSL